MNATDLRVQQLNLTLKELNDMIKPNVKGQQIVFVTSDKKYVTIQGRLTPFDIKKIILK